MFRSIYNFLTVIVKTDFQKSTENNVFCIPGHKIDHAHNVPTEFLHSLESKTFNNMIVILFRTS